MERRSPNFSVAHTDSDESHRFPIRAQSSAWPSSYFDRQTPACTVGGHPHQAVANCLDRSHQGLDREALVGRPHERPHNAMLVTPFSLLSLAVRTMTEVTLASWGMSSHRIHLPYRAAGHRKWVLESVVSKFRTRARLRRLPRCRSAIAIATSALGEKGRDRRHL